MKHPAVIVKLPDDERLFIVYNKQPLIEEKGMVVLHLVDEKYNIIMNEKDQPKVLLKEISRYNSDMRQKVIKVIGYID